MGRSFKKLVCNPKHKKSRKEYSCYDDKTLLLLKDTWNRKHPDNKIVSTNNEDMYKELQQKLTECSHEICFMEKMLDSRNDTEKFKKEFFAPIAPKKWNSNINEWLSNIDINAVLRQYEDAYPEFKNIGPTSIDFDKNTGDRCVEPELCNLNLKPLYQNGKRKFGIVFNLSPSDTPGTHWVSLFIDLNKQFVFYFDSCGDKIPKEIDALVKRIISQSKELGIILKEENSYKVDHQQGGTECGMYALYFIINLLEEIKSPSFFKKKGITDKEMESFRHFYFNVLLDE
jgi:hypothetical protein